MVHVPAKFWENKWMHFQVTVRKLNVTDGQMDGRIDRWMDGGRCNISRPRAYGAAGDKTHITLNQQIITALNKWYNI